jgi:hypothetical protein
MDKSENQKSNDLKRVGALRKEIESLNAKIAQKREVLNEREPQFKKASESVDLAKREITPETLKKAYQFLEQKQAEPVTFVMEALIGLLRGMRRADTKSVELYIKKHEGFMIGVNRLDLKKMNPQHCQEHLDALKKRYNAALNSEEFVLFHPFRTLLVQILLASLTVQDVAKVE